MSLAAHFNAESNSTVSGCLVGVQFPWYYVHRESLIPGVPDEVTSTLAMAFAYWTVSIIYHCLDISGWQWLEKYRLQTSKQPRNKNMVTKGQVIRTVAFQQIAQTAFVIFCLRTLYVPESFKDHAQALNGCSSLAHTVYWWLIPIAQVIIALFILDTCQYFLHRTFHEVPFFYKHFHSRHHRIYVLYAFGSLYGHPFEGAILDGLSGIISFSLTGMTARQGILLFTFATYKTVEDHCGYCFPWHPMHMLFGNNPEYHDIHHQPLFIHWDVILGTRMTMEELRAKQGTSKQKQTKSL